MARRVLGMWGLLAFALLLLPTGFASFPYNADWLRYADMRLIYEIDVSDIPNNEPNIYVTVDIDPSTLQSFIDRWSDFCDNLGRYDWFYPTFTYASTINKGQRMLKVVEYNNWQTFTVGSCGSVELPTRFVLLLPNGVLDGPEHQYHKHYVFVYLKYPYADDFYDNPVGFSPEEYDIISGSATTDFSFTFKKGHCLRFDGYLKIWREFVVDLSKPFYICCRVYEDDGVGLNLFLGVSHNEYEVEFPQVERCLNISPILRRQGLSGEVTIEYIKMWDKAGVLDQRVYYIWPIPQSVLRRILYGS